MRQSVLTPLMEEIVRARYPHADTEDLAAELDISIDVLRHAATHLQVKKTPEAIARANEKAAARRKETIKERGGYHWVTGEKHPRARLSDHEIELIRTLKEEGMPPDDLAVKFEIHKRYVYKICAYERR